MSAPSAGGFDYLGATVSGFTPGEFVDIYQGTMSTPTGLSVRADASGTVHFTAGSSANGLQLAVAYPPGTTKFIAVGETSGRQFNSVTFQIQQKISLANATWFNGDSVQVSGFQVGSSGTVCLNTSGHTTGCDASLGSVTVAASNAPYGTALFTISPKPASGSYQVVVTISGQTYANPLNVS